MNQREISEDSNCHAPMTMIDSENIKFVPINILKTETNYIDFDYFHRMTISQLLFGPSFDLD